MTSQNTIKKIISNINSKKPKIICIDGITCSGKTYFSNLLYKKIKQKHKYVNIISKDFFLYSREKRIKIIQKSLNKTKNNQNDLHYNLKKINLLLLAFKNKKKIIFKNLYNRKNGKNNLTKAFNFKNTNLIVFEGLYSLENIIYSKKELYSILIYEKIYVSLIRKIQRIRDKKISVQDLISEFTNIHLASFLKYLRRYEFDLCLKIYNKEFILDKSGKKKQIMLINSFQKKHLFKSH